MMTLEPAHTPWKQLIRRGKILIRWLRDAVVLLLAPWCLHRSLFSPDSKSVYKRLGWGIPTVPAGLLIFAMHPALPPGGVSPGERYAGELLLGLFAYVGILGMASLPYSFHALMCWVGRLYGFDEHVPPFEYFLVKSSGLVMWFATTFFVMAIPLLASEGSWYSPAFVTIMHVPLIYSLLFMVVGSLLITTLGERRYGLGSLYDSAEFTKRIKRIRFSLFVTMALFTSMFYAKLVYDLHNP